MNAMDIIDSKIDPWAVLEISREAEDREIENAWRDKSSTGRNRDKVHLAYKMIASAEDRARLMLLSPGIPESLDEIQDQMPLRSRYSGPGIWYSSLKKVLEVQDSK
ncbi:MULTISPECIES: hypothetical protein [unclassified Oceanispirochaeta]|uniref:hypothetical protein n=1 Tax=unclassified Oceanispirochaeta TaxID=2635722 RepID=UPI000E08DB7A|nr:MULTISPECIES: hypothetical protein [unclassified Oceanispirochaeta]MBF9014756.1 hypothetical protein [Oceanispirochaeta sp. M2]NPD71012.1 hypothetical protein [Oceanispirochaeta sp. M1]RDG33845.1 hypothetical protein DV872_02770 [Oceanispirochaeta sp. M1]